jgi:hypothetical protein
MGRSSSGKLLAAAIPVVVVAALLITSSSLAKNVGNGPKLPVTAPIAKKLPKGKALIVLKFKSGKVTSLTGSAVPLGATVKPPKGSPQAVQSTKCTVNFTHATKSTSTRTAASWFGGVGCRRSMFLFGQAYLQQNATKVDSAGGHYQVTNRSALSGRNRTIVNSPHASLYIRHLTNIYFPPGTGSGQISVYPGQGQVLNAASKCVKATFGKYGLGVHCDLYTNRF